MIQLQVINKILSTSDYSIVTNNYLTVEHFTGYEPEFTFISDHYAKYGNVPDRETFLDKFPEFDFIEVAETDKYLVDTLSEEYLFTKSAPILKKAAELLKSDSLAAAEYLNTQMAILQPAAISEGVDIISQARERYDKYIETREHQRDSFFESGFQELDEITHGIKRGEELFVIVARTNQGKSWILEKMCSHVWKIGFNVGYVSPEMTATSIGYRFDTLFSNFSNKSLAWGKDDLDQDTYNSYIGDLESRDNKFMVAIPKDFGYQMTVGKIKQWILAKKLDLVAIDGITYMADERASRNDSTNTRLTHISEDLMAMSVELGVPVLVVVQANRSGVATEENSGTPELESIRDSDGIAHNASIVISIRQKKDNVLEMGIKKQRTGSVGGKLNYTWDIDTGNFTFIPSFDDAEPVEHTRKKVEDTKAQFKSSGNVF